MIDLGQLVAWRTLQIPDVAVHLIQRLAALEPKAQPKAQAKTTDAWQPLQNLHKGVVSVQ